MKRLLLSSAAVALISGTAYAADLPIMEAPAAIVAPTPVALNWTGVYIGIHGGYGWADDLSVNGRHCLVDDDDDDDDDDCNGSNRDDFNFDSNVEGAVLGGQIGINWQWDWFVLGAEGDASWAGIDHDGDDNDRRRSSDDDDDDDDDDIFNDDNDIIDFLASARLRAGVGLDRLLIYGTGGVGFASLNDPFADHNGRRNNNNNNNNNDDDDDDDDGDIETGWVAGGGAEFLVTDNVTVGAEYLHYDFGDNDDDDNDRRRRGDSSRRNRTTFDRDFDADVDVVRGRVNVKFGGLFGG